MRSLDPLSKDRIAIEQLFVSSGKLDRRIWQGTIDVILKTIFKYTEKDWRRKISQPLEFIIFIRKFGKKDFLSINYTDLKLRSRNPLLLSLKADFCEMVEWMTEFFAPTICKLGTQIFACKFAGIEKASSIGRNCVV